MVRGSAIAAVLTAALAVTATTGVSGAERPGMLGLLQAPFPCLSQQQPGATLTDAYAAQQVHNQLREASEPIAGFKAGLTSAALQQRFQSDGAVFGVLFRYGERTPNVGIALRDFRNAKLETEIGFLVTETITAPLADVAALRRHFGYVVPVIEVPDVSFVAGCTANAVDLVAANVAAWRHIRGKPVVWADLPALSTIRVQLQRDGTLIASGEANAVQPSVEASLLQLVNTALAQGYAIEPGQLFITGALSGLIDAAPGEHVADFGALGLIRFPVTP